jgi:uncharacterized membrane protein
MNTKPLIAAGTLMGIGMGGFVDGILFHEILQIHNMLSAVYPPNTLVNAKANMIWDGFFHALTWLTTAISIAMLWNVARRPEVPLSGLTFIGSLIMGWGIFNLVEGIIDHHILHLHHVVELAGESIYDYLFLASGVLFFIIGLMIIKAQKKNLEITY